MLKSLMEILKYLINSRLLAYFIAWGVANYVSYYFFTNDNAPNEMKALYLLIGMVNGFLIGESVSDFSHLTKE